MSYDLKGIDFLSQNSFIGGKFSRLCRNSVSRYNSGSLTSDLLELLIHQFRSMSSMIRSWELELANLPRDSMLKLVKCGCMVISSERRPRYLNHAFSSKE